MARRGRARSGSRTAERPSAAPLWWGRGRARIKLVADNLCQQHLRPAQPRRARRAALVLLEHRPDEHARLAVEGQPQILLGVMRQTWGKMNNVVRFYGGSPTATIAPNGADRRPDYTHQAPHQSHAHSHSMGKGLGTARFEWGINLVHSGIANHGLQLYKRAFT